MIILSTKQGNLEKDVEVTLKESQINLLQSALRHFDSDTVDTERLRRYLGDQL